MRNILIVALLVVISVAAQAQQQPTATATTQEEISALRAEIAELKAAIAGLQAAQPQKTVSIGVLPIEHANWIPEVGESFRQILVSAFNEAGIKTVESLDHETVNWVLEQDRLVRERVISPVTAPKRGELRGVTHFLLGTVTSYREEEATDEGAVILGILRVKVSGGYSVKRGSLIVDFRLVDAESGDVVVAFKTEAVVKQKDYGGVVFKGGGAYGRRQMKSMPELAARSVAEEAAERIAILLNSQVVTPAATATTTATTVVKK